LDQEFVPGTSVAQDVASALTALIIVSLFFLLALWDLALNAACGAAAVAVGDHVNSSPLIADDLKAGALGGLIGAGMINTIHILAAALNVGWIAALLYLGGAWGFSIAVTATICALRLGSGISVP
jgi:hypothetical protein